MIKVCILGTGLTSLALAKALINIGIYVDIFFNLKKIKKQNKSRTIGMSQSNIKFFNQNIYVELITQKKKFKNSSI